ncbi:MAG: hypothetical protein K0Q93_149 [Nocardioidaceae bacterium]|nr:hypothetical protein [Nocardioidaceae bacterium]
MDHFQHVARHLASSIPGVRLVTLPWAGHLPGLESPQHVSDLLLDFLLPASPSSA